MTTSKTIFVTQPSMPPLEDFLPYLKKIWESKRLTNNGPFHKQLEIELSNYLGVEHLSLFANATIALLTALQALRITGEVITTPFSFVATTHSLMWNNIRPIFVDIDPYTYNIDPERIEEAITSQTTAIMPVHCYGNPCDVERIQRIADTYGLKVIYDAAHAFGVKYKDESILRHGDMSVLSFHATKVFNTFEGGAIICHDEKTKQRIGYLKNFGFADEVTVTAAGINGKMSEVNAAFGILQLKSIDVALDRRREIHQRYRDNLYGTKGVIVPSTPPQTIGNASYFPVLIDEDRTELRDSLYEYLKANEIYGRRYFYPLISEFPIYRGIPSAKPSNLPRAMLVSRQILCLPIYPDLADEEVDHISALIKEFMNERK